MKERYKVLGAMTALGEFTVEDVVNKTGVKKNTVSTVLVRDKALLEEVPCEGTGRRGGQPKKYRIRPESAHLVHSELEDLYQSLPKSTAFSAPASEKPKWFKMPLGLLTAEDTLLQRYPKSKDLEEKQQLLELAELDYQKGIFESERILAETGELTIRRTIRNSVDRINALQKVFEIEVVANSLDASRTDQAVEPSDVKAWLRQLRNQVSEAISSLIPVLTSARESLTANPSESTLRPLSEHYLTARSLLDRACLERQLQIRSALLHKAGDSLDRLRSEFQSSEYPEVSNAFVDYEEGRLKFLMRDNEAARELFERARDSFGSSDKYADEVTKIDHYLAIIFVKENSFSQGVPDSRMEVPSTLSALNRIEDNAQANYPLVGFLKNLLARSIHEFTQTERQLGQALESAQRRVRALEHALQLKQPARIRMEAPLPEALIFGLPHTGIPSVRDLGTVRPRLPIRTGLTVRPDIVIQGTQCYDPTPTELGVMEMNQAIALGSENTLQCSRIEPRGRLKIATEGLVGSKW